MFPDSGSLHSLRSNPLTIGADLDRGPEPGVDRERSSGQDRPSPRLFMDEWSALQATVQESGLLAPAPDAAHDYADAAVLASARVAPHSPSIAGAPLVDGVSAQKGGAKNPDEAQVKLLSVHQTLESVVDEVETQRGAPLLSLAPIFDATRTDTDEEEARLGQEVLAFVQHSALPPPPKGASVPTVRPIPTGFVSSAGALRTDENAKLDMLGLLSARDPDAPNGFLLTADEQAARPVAQSPQVTPAPGPAAALVVRGQLGELDDRIATTEGETQYKIFDASRTDGPVRLAPTSQSVAVAHQVIAAIRQEKGSGTVEVRLDPPELGRVRIAFLMERQDIVTALVTSERPETLDLLRRHASDLSKELERAGFTSVTINFSAADSSQHHQSNAEAGSLRNYAADPESAEAASTTTIYVEAFDDRRLNRLA